MVAGFGAYFEQEIGAKRIIGSSILVIMTAIVFFTSVKGVLKVSEYIVPLLILFIIITSFTFHCYMILFIRAIFQLSRAVF